ncbi:DUF5710 domain-containing protein [Cupriavidus basilensis]|uniref:Uncharacterized protein n=1 Tax=Cupriavidus basilensis TaxID=68895 RepID=A0A643FSP7_9BURK|nr:DUF5710 domain-containing protein [Cupriavidus basilensis]QOT82263.1 hypothetical protein F7R26_039175 [Cupriavidus basilensis]
MIMMGDTGSGKTHQLRHVCDSLVRSSSAQTRIHVLDRHGDIDVQGASSVFFSQSADFGINPLELNPDPHYGGVRKRVQAFISGINRTSQRLGHRQEAVLRNLLLDLYRSMGFSLDDPRTWHAANAAEIYSVPGKEDRLYLEVPYEEIDRAKKCGIRWDGDEKAWWCPHGEHTGERRRWPAKVAGQRYPTLLDAIRFSNNRLKAMFLGSSQQAVRSLEAVQRVAKSLAVKQRRAARMAEVMVGEEEISAELAEARAKAIAAYTAAVNAMVTGRELDDLLKYDSIETVKSVVDRLENFYAMGVFRSVPPPHDPGAKVHRYVMTALHDDAQKLLVDTKAEEIFSRAMQRGEQSEVRDVLVVDEATVFISDEKDHILNRIAKEGRKFGVMLLLASQGPGHFTDDLMSAAGTKVMLGFDRNQWRDANRMLGMSTKALEWIIPRRRCVITMKVAGELQSGTHWVNFQAL